MLYAIYHCKRYGEDKEKIHAEVQMLHDKGLLKVLKESFFALLSPVIILGCIYTGVASPTEAAVISVFYALIISLFVYKSIKLRDIWPILVEAIRTFTPILFILASLYCLLQSTDSDAGTADRQRIYPEQFPQSGCNPADH